MDKNFGLVADILHGVIAITDIEKFVMATPIFNRLHNVKQNSTAYLTYPSMVHSRYEHSLGVMHISGQMLKAGISNATTDDRRKFLSTANTLIQHLCRSNDIVPSTRHGLGDLTATTKVAALKRGAEASKIAFNSAPHDVSEDEKIAYAVVFQALRLAAMVHDLGHPPFSHVTEFAIKEIAADVIMNPPAVSIDEALKKIGGESKNNKKQLHEKLTGHLFSLIAGLRREECEDNEASRNNYVFASVSIGFAQIILDKEELSRFCADLRNNDDVLALIQCLQSLEDGDLDCDRLDYVQRDVVMSGIREKSFRMERLISLLTLVFDSPSESDEEKKFIDPSIKIPRIIPSIRSMRSFEEFCEWRTTLYKTVIYHHHVVKTDALFQALIEKLGREAIDAPKESTSSEFNHLDSTVQSLRWLWNIFERGDGATRLMDTYLQWDDHWLMSVLRRKYIELRSKHTNALDNDEKIKFKRLEEIVANKKNYISLVKRYEHYGDIGRGFDEKWKTLFTNWINASVSNMTATNDSSQKLKTANVLLEKRSSQASRETIFYDLALALNQVYPPDVNSKNSSEGLAKKMRIVIDRSSQHLSTSLGLLEIFWQKKTIKPAVKKDFRIATDAGVNFLDSQSNLIRDYDLKNTKSLEYFFYALPKSTSFRIDGFKFRKQLGEHLADETFSLITTT